MNDVVVLLIVKHIKSLFSYNWNTTIITTYAEKEKVRVRGRESE